MSSSKNRKVDNESRVYQEKWTNDYYFIQIKDKPMCLLCSESVSVIKEYNVKKKKRKEIDNISLSCRTVTRRIDELATNVELGLKRLYLQFKYFSLTIDESTDVSNIAQRVGVFVRRIDEDLNITEEMLGLRGMKDTTTGEGIFQELKMLMARFNLHFKNFHDLSTDGVPVMIGSKAGLVSKISSELASMNIDTKDLSIFYCIIHQENLCAKSLKFEYIMSKIVLSIIFIKSRALNHRQFKEFLEDIEAEYGDLAYYCEVRWLSKGKMLKRFYDLRSEIFTFLEMKGKSMSELSDDG
ncbi:general transcription factor II-I repeat domain-containing protein 2-like [Octopus sinensis]|uniref:General transcription factor II-I repeat domain-containing protein 2-like n=1 Tax=Octopus sinensis TaxID=2607531 RepID=A0A6P7SHX1_9MOLL|nr:general transcription factor II-I repeat domain-containing protein 2-like [Octopus sinensis]